MIRDVDANILTINLLYQINSLILKTGTMKSKIVKMDFKGLNPRYEELTVEKLRELENNPDMPEEEAKEIILSIKIFVNIVLQIQALKEKNKNNTDYLNNVA